MVWLNCYSTLPGRWSKFISLQEQKFLLGLPFLASPWRLWVQYLFTVDSSLQEGKLLTHATALYVFLMFSVWKLKDLACIFFAWNYQMISVWWNPADFKEVIFRSQTLILQHLSDLPNVVQLDRPNIELLGFINGDSPGQVQIGVNHE